MSYGIMNAALIHQACGKYEADRREYIDKKKEEHVQEAMKPRKFFWFRLRARTREEALKYIKNDRWNGYHFEDYAFRKEAERIERLKHLSKSIVETNGETVIVSAEDANSLSRWL
jgi:hypothetical protein